jgi:hypothetical protein
MPDNSKKFSANFLELAFNPLKSDLKHDFKIFYSVYCEIYIIIVDNSLRLQNFICCNILRK